MDKVDILVATPLRLKSLIEKKKCHLSAVQYLVLDEADKLFEMGFVEQVDAAVAACDGPEVTRALFSATLPETVRSDVCFIPLHSTPFHSISFHAYIPIKELVVA